ncbi:MAG: TIGR00374 family protein [Acidobacteria bacterium]|nr:MAG: TIGR00374 family protein [Acidobacteriota bacterium]
MYRSIFLGILFTFIIVVGSTLYIFKKTFSKEFIGMLFLLDRKYLLLSLLSMFLYHTFDNLRLFVLSRAMNLRYPFFYGYLISLINTFGATITPAHIGGEFMSFYTLSRKGGKLHKVMSIVTMKTITGTAFFLLALPLMLYQLYKNPQQIMEIVYVVLFFLVAMVVIYWFFRFFLNRKPKEGKLSQRIRYTLRRYAVILRMFYRYKKVSIAQACFFSVLLYLSFLASGAFLAKSLDEGLSFYGVMESQLALLYAIFISPTPGGSGVGEIGALYAFEPFIEASLIGGFSLVWRFITQYMSAFIGGLVLALLIFKDARKYGKPL